MNTRTRRRLDKMTRDMSEEFKKKIVDCIDALEAVYENQTPLPNYRFELLHKQFLASRNRPTVNETERLLRNLWSFDERFFGETIPFSSWEYEWATYSLVYLAKEKDFICNILKIYPFLLSDFSKELFGREFWTKTGATYMDHVGHYLWEVQGLNFETHDYIFDWHRNRNKLTPEEICSFLEKTNLPPLLNPDYPPQKVLCYFLNSNTFNCEADYLRELALFYEDKGYSV